MAIYLDSKNFPAQSDSEKSLLSMKLTNVLDEDYDGNMFTMLASYQRVLADNNQREHWPEIHNKLETLFKCGRAVPLDGPMIGIPVSIRDTDWFKEVANLLGEKRSALASVEILATAWNSSFADTGLWMGKTYEPISQEKVNQICEDDPDVMANYDADTTRIGRNFFRQPPDPSAIQGLGLPTISKFWHLQNRPNTIQEKGFIGELREENLEKEKAIPYSKTGGIFLANNGQSVVPEMLGKDVFQLNYRWENLNPVYPMTKLIDEIVQIADGVYLGQLVYASKHFSLGSIDVPFMPGDKNITLGESYHPREEKSFWTKFWNRLFSRETSEYVDYGYQNNGYFLMMDPAFAKQVYADDAFPQLRPRSGETGWKELGYDKIAKSKTGAIGDKDMDWKSGWQEHILLREKFTKFTSEASPKEFDTEDVQAMRKENESILQMLQRISADISVQTNKEDHLKHFESLHRLFRGGVAPQVKDGFFRGAGKKGFNTFIDSPTSRDWYGEKESTTGFNYYHGATLNLHWGFHETAMEKFDDSFLFPSALASMIDTGDLKAPNVLNMVWQSVGRYIFPWAGKSFEKISGRKLSMLLDESDDLEVRYPERVRQLKTYLAGLPYYDLIRKNRQHYWSQQGQYAEHLASGSWDRGMTQEDKDFWSQLADEHWVFGYNLQDRRIQAMDVIMRIADMNYRTPDRSIQAVANSGPSPFIRQGYSFLGVDNQESNLSINNGADSRKKVFQFNYRFPMMGGPTPINFCLDEIVELAEGLFLGQLIYATALDEPFHSSVDPEKYQYQLFGYFLLLDDDWERHRQAINFDVWRKDKEQQSSFGLSEIF